MSTAFDEELILPAELRDSLDVQADLFSIIVGLEYVEKAFVKDSITAEQYGPACTKLLSQYKTIVALLPENISLVSFMQEYNMTCPAALQRLTIGIPATIEHSLEPSSSSSAKNVAETTQSFITFMDGLRLSLRAKDQLHPMLTELITLYSNFPRAAESVGRGKLVGWLILLNRLKASEELQEEQARQLLFDLDHAYAEFKSSL